MNCFRNLAGAACAAALGLASMASTAKAEYGQNAAFFGGLAAGVVGSAIVNGAGSSNGGYRPNGYYAAPVYDRRRCWFVVEPVYGYYDQVVGERRVRRCNY